MMCKTSKQLNCASRRSSSERQFPGKLHDMMTYVEQEGLEHIVSWIHKGRGFKVHDPQKLVKFLPLFFSQTKYRSFSRQLNMWHFERVTDGSCKGAFVHPYFLRGHKLLCGKMSRYSKLPLSSYPISMKQLEAPWHFTNEIGESSAGVYPSRAAAAAAASPPSSPSYSSAKSALHEHAAILLPSSSEEDEQQVNSDRKIRAKKGEPPREFRDGDLTYFAGRQFYFLDVDDSPRSTERIIPPIRLQPNQVEPHQRTDSQAAFSDMQERKIFLAQQALLSKMMGSYYY
jgi:hypothetical protein